MAGNIWAGERLTSLGQSDVTGLVHFEHQLHKPVTESLDFTSICQMVKNLSFEISTLNICLFFRQIAESPRIQRKFRAHKNFSAKLSTETVDSFPLATGHGSLQPSHRIAAAKVALSA
jgi:hypothetical protein